MKSFLIAYDLTKNNSYQKLINRIEDYPVAQKVMNTTFVIKTDVEATAETILENLKTATDPDDRIIVLQLKGSFAESNSLTTIEGLKTLIK